MLNRSKPRHHASKNAGLPASVRVSAIETLEKRTLLASAGVFSLGNIPITPPTSANVADTKNGPLATAGADLIGLYTEYRRFRNGGGTDANFHTTAYDRLMTDKGIVVVTLRGRNGLTALGDVIHAAGGEIIARSTTYTAISAFVPISQLHDLAVADGVATVSPVYRPIDHQQGVADNQADTALSANVARSTYGLDGSGVKIGVLSDSVDQFGNGIAGSIATGDLPSQGVEVIQDITETQSILHPATDEGRAMLELIHDIAPGSSLAFATASLGQLSFAQNIRALHAAGANVIVDDFSYANEPAYQPGVIQQAIDSVTKDGASYFTSAGNFADAGFETGISFTTINGSKYVDFDPSANVDTRLRISSSGGPVYLQWDNPFNGVVGNATSDLDLYFYDTTHPNRLLATSTSANIKTGIPLEAAVLGDRSYDLVIKLSDIQAGASLPTRIKVNSFQDNSTLVPEYDYTRSTVLGHEEGASTIVVGATAFSDTTAYNPTAATVNSESFSSDGPATQVFDANGNRLSRVQSLLKPDISSVDGVNTSFFTGASFGSINLPRNGDIPEDPDSLPNFFGTSAAAPNAAAVAALIKQADPTATADQIRNALINSATPLNGAATGTWTPQGGYGLIDASTAVQQFVNAPTVQIIPVSNGPTASTIDSIKIVFSQQVINFDVSDLILSVDGSLNQLTGDNQPRTTDGGRTYIVPNLSTLTAAAGTYTLTLTDVTGITNVVGLPLVDGTETTFVKSLPAIPATPSALRAKVLSDSAIQLRFTDNADDEDGFTIQRADDASFSVNVRTIHLKTTNASTYTDTSLASGHAYYYRVRADQSLSRASAFGASVRAVTLAKGEVILDNESSSGVKINGSWATTSSVDGFYGSSYLDDNNTGKGSKSVVYTPNLEGADDYYVYMRWTRDTNRATNVPVTITDARGKATTVFVNERADGGDGYVLLGKFHFNKGAGSSLTVDTQGTNGHVIADAVRFLPTDGGDAFNA